MRLEDILKRAPENQEEQPIGSNSSLSEFFAKRTPKETAPVSFNEELNPIIDENAVEKIKRAYSPNQDKFFSVSDVVDTKKIKEQAKELVPDMGWGDVLTGLTPVAMEAILGGGQAYSASPAISSKYLLGELEKTSKRRQTLEDKLMELKKIGAAKKGGGLQMKSLINKDTQEKTIGMFDPAGALTDLSGNILDPNKYAVSSGLSEPEFRSRQAFQSQQQIKTARELGRDLKTDPSTGLLGRWENGSFNPVQVPAGLLNPVQKRDLDTTISKFTTTDAYKKPLATLQAASSVNELLKDATSGNPTAAEMARSELAKMAEGGSRLSDQDVQRIGGDQSIRGIARRYVNLQKTGISLMPEDLDNLRKVAETLYKVNRVKMMDSVGGLEKAYAQKGGIPGAVQTAILPFIPSSPSFKTNAMPSQSSGDMVKVISPTGKPGSIPSKNLEKALKNGYKRAP